MAVHTFFNPDLVSQLAACGITARRRLAPTAPTAGFVLEGRRAPRGREAITNVIAEHSQVKITGPRRPNAADRPRNALPAAAAAGPQSALELAQENARLRRENQLLADEVARLRGDLARSSRPPARGDQAQDLDDAATRFSLLELDL